MSTLLVQSEAEILEALAQGAVPEEVSSGYDWFLLMPFLILAVGAILLLTFTSLFRVLQTRNVPAVITAVTAASSFASLFFVWRRVDNLGGAELILSGSFQVDAFTLFVTGVLCAAVFFAALSLAAYTSEQHIAMVEWYVLLLISAAGGVLLVSAQDLILLFIGLEVLSIAVYVLAAMHPRRETSREASFKYFILGGLASAIFLYGIALTYGATGSLSLAGIAEAGVNPAGLSPQVNASMILVAMGLLLAGFAFKVSAVPFHFWAPDVYEGSPTPVVAYMASGVKVAAFAAMARVFIAGFGNYVADWQPVLAGLAIASLIIGSLLALGQSNVKRMLAYSSIVHAGFLLLSVHSLAFKAVNGSKTDTSLDRGSSLTDFSDVRSFLFYLAAYTVMVSGTFGVLSLLAKGDDGMHSLADYQGIAKQKPFLAGLLAVLLFAQSGVPFTVGFWSKFQVIWSAARNESYLLAGLAMLAAVVAAVLYLRVVVSMYLKGPAETVSITERHAEKKRNVSSSARAMGLTAVTLSVAATIVWGVAPNLGDSILDAAAQALTIL